MRRIFAEEPPAKREDFLLRGMIEGEIRCAIVAARATERENTRMFSRAIIVQRRWLRAGGCERGGSWLVGRCVSAALQRAFVEANFFKNRGDRRDVLGLAVVRCGHHGNLALVESIAFVRT